MKFSLEITTMKNTSRFRSILDKNTGNNHFKTVSGVPFKTCAKTSVL